MRDRSLGKFVFVGATGVITGAASGIGRATALGLADRGMNLALVDRDAAGLESLVAELHSAHPALRLTHHVADLSDHGDFADLVDEVTTAHDTVNLLMNNAGVALGGRLSDISMDDIDWITTINYRSVVALTKGFLPALTRATPAHLVNVSSLFGLIAPAGQSAYVGTKFAVRGFTESIRGELLPLGIGVTVVHPGGIRTNIANSARVPAGVSESGRASMNRMLTMPAEDAAALIIRAIERRDNRLVISRLAKQLDWMSRTMPSRYIPLVNRRVPR